MKRTCDCNCNPAHSDEALCARNREATRVMMSRRTDAHFAGVAARLERCRAERMASTHGGCDLCQPAGAGGQGQGGLR